MAKTKSTEDMFDSLFGKNISTNKSTESIQLNKEDPAEFLQNEISKSNKKKNPLNLKGIYITDEQVSNLKLISMIRNKSLPNGQKINDSYLVREALEEYFAKEENQKILELLKNL